MGIQWDSTIFELMSKLFDNHNRPINYLRLAVTDRCNLRCFYCMPEEGIDYVPKADLLTYEEMYRVVDLLSSLGISKVRVTGGEPFVRKGMFEFIRQLCARNELSVHLTTNGTMTGGLVPQFKKIGLQSVNLSLDTLDSEKFFHITRRDEFAKVRATLDELIASGLRTKVNMVVMAGKNTDDIIPMAELTREYPIEVRYIEEMPFNGEGARATRAAWNHVDILLALQRTFPGLQKNIDPPNSTATTYRISGYQGTIGIIAAYSRTFCGTCDRIRITPQGLLKTCLYDGGVFNVRDLIRNGANDAQLKEAFLQAFSNRARDGHEAERRRIPSNPVSESMSTIGG